MATSVERSMRGTFNLCFRDHPPTRPGPALHRSRFRSAGGSVRIASIGERLRRPRRRLTALVALVTAVTAVLGWGLVSPRPAAAAAVLVGSGSGRCLDVKGNVATAGT